LKRTLERLQVYSMLLYYPLEHVAFLGSHQIIALSPERQLKYSLWSVRAWAVYTFAELANLHLRSKAIALRLRTELSSDELKAARAEEAAIRNSFIVNMAYLPLTVHWSFAQGIGMDQLSVGLCGVVAAIAQLRASWKANAPLPK